MTTCEKDDKLTPELSDKSKAHENGFRLGVTPFDPLHVIIALIYGLTR